MTDKEQMKCKYKFQDKEKFDGKTYCTCFCELCEDLPPCDDNCQIYEDYKQLARKTQECEELKRKVDLMMDCPDCKVDEYKKTLEEIEEVCGADTRTFADGTQLRYNSLDKILDIINKTKGKSND